MPRIAVYSIWFMPQILRIRPEERLNIGSTDRIRSGGRLWVQLAFPLPRQQVIHGQTAPAVDKDQHQKKQNEGGEFQLLPRLNTHHIGQMNVENCPEQDRYLGQGGYSGQ